MLARKHLPLLNMVWSLLHCLSYICIQVFNINLPKIPWPSVQLPNLFLGIQPPIRLPDLLPALDINWPSLPSIPGFRIPLSSVFHYSLLVLYFDLRGGHDPYIEPTPCTNVIGVLPLQGVSSYIKNSLLK